MKGHGGLYKAPTKEERRKQKAKRRERSDQVDKVISLVRNEKSNLICNRNGLTNSKLFFSLHGHQAITYSTCLCYFDVK